MSRERIPGAQKPAPAFHADKVPATPRNESADHERRSQGLLRRLHEGDCQLFYDTTEGFLPNVYAFVRSMVDDASTAGDLCEQTLTIAFEKVRQLRELRSLKSWVMQIAANQIRMSWRSSQRYPIDFIDTFEDCGHPRLVPATPVAARETPPEAASSAELKSMLDAALRQLTPNLRFVFWLHDIERFSAAEAAAILGISIDCVKARLLHARLKLRDQIAPALGVEATRQSCAKSRSNK